MEISLLGPFGDHGWVYVSDEHMDVLQCTDRLQSNPVLEPHYSLLTAWSQPVGEVRLHKVADEPPTLISDIASRRVRGNDRSSPNNNMGDVGSEPIGPVVQKNTEVGGLCEGDLGDGGKREGTPGLWQAVLQEVVRHAAISSLRLGSPFHVSPKVRRLTLQHREVVGFWMTGGHGQDGFERQGR